MISYISLDTWIQVVVPSSPSQLTANHLPFSIKSKRFNAIEAYGMNGETEKLPVNLNPGAGLSFLSTNPMAIRMKTIMVYLVLLLGLKPACSGKGDSESFTYNGFGTSNLNLSGSSMIKSKGLLQLTDSSFGASEIGHAFFSNPIQFKISSEGNVFSFSTTFVFAIVSEVQNLTGHGLAFVISPSKEIKGATASLYLGLFNESNNGNSSNHVFAVELDTVRNIEFHDPDNNHVGIDINGMSSNKYAHAAYFSNGTKQLKNLSLASGDPIQVWVEYDGAEKVIEVTLSPLKTPKPDRPLLSYGFDLSQILLNSMYAGFSAGTGAFASSHYIMGWSFKMNGKAEPLDFSGLPSLPRRRSRSMSNITLWISIVTVVLMIGTISGSVYIWRRRKFEEILEDWEREYGPHRFSYKDLFKATKGFMDKMLLGAGGFGTVYKGVLPSSKIEVAVKRVSHESKQGLREFVAEIVSLGRLRHRNLVQLLGYCRRKGELLLVYDFMPNGSLDTFIFDQKKPTLNWDQRFKILKGVASGLLYLHEEWEQVVIHRDVKSSNVLLDSDFNGRLGDFGLARLYDHGSNPQTTHIVGTLGYMAPELSRIGKATTSTDIFAFGALLLEVACGRRPIEPQASIKDIILVEWVLDCWKRGVILECSDRKLGGDFVVEEMELVLKLGLLCSHPVYGSRPSMRQVMQFLVGDTPLPEISPELLIGAGLAATKEEGFDEFLRSYRTTLGTTSTTDSVKGTEVLLSGGR